MKARWYLHKNTVEQIKKRDSKKNIDSRNNIARQYQLVTKLLGWQYFGEYLGVNLGIWHGKKGGIDSVPIQMAAQKANTLGQNEFGV